MKKRVLIIASHSTFRMAPRGIQANRFIQEIAKHHEVYLLTCNTSTQGIERPYGERLEYWESLDMPQATWRRALRVVTPYFLQFSPMWILNAYRKGVELIEAHSIDVVITLSMTLSNVEVGYKIKSKLPAVRLLSFFSDPISISPYFARNALERWMFSHLEKRYFSASSNVISPSELMTEAYITKYGHLGRGKFLTIPHSYSAQLGLKEGLTRVEETDVRVIRYIGGMNTIRSPLPLIKFIESNSHWFLERGFRFEFYGGLSRELRSKVSRLRFNERLVAFCGKVPYQDVAGLIKSSSALLVIDADFEPSLSFGNSKAIEILPYGIPIIALTPIGSETERRLSEIGYPSFAHDQLDHIKTILTQIGQVNPDSSKIESFSIQSNTNRWNDLIIKS